MDYRRRDFMKVAGLGGLVFASGLPGCASYGQAGSGKNDFHFVQLSDVHWGYDEPEGEPGSRGTLQKAVAAVNSPRGEAGFRRLHRGPDADHRRSQGAAAAPQRVPRAGRRAQGPEGVLLRRRARCLARPRRGVPGNVRRPAPLHLRPQGHPLHRARQHLRSRAHLGEKQIAWLKADLARQKADAPIVVLTHRPLFPLAAAVGLGDARRHGGGGRLMPFRNVTVFYGHIHHEHHHRTGHIEHHAAKAVMFPLSPAGTAPQKTQMPWNPASRTTGWASAASRQAPRARRRSYANCLSPDRAKDRDGRRLAIAAAVCGLAGYYAAARGATQHRIALTPSSSSSAPRRSA